MVTKQKKARVGRPAQRVGLRLLRRRAVEEKTGLSKSAIYRLMEEKCFPLPVRIAARAVGWVEAEVDEWIERQMAQRAA